jgi:hypothetical protein
VVFLIVLGVVVILIAGVWSAKRMKVLASKRELERELQSVINSFEELKAKIGEADLRDHEKATLVGNIDQNIEMLQRWKQTALPNVTFFKNHTAPIEKEFNSLRESVANELSRYEGLPDVSL